MKEKLEQIRREALAALSETKTAQDLDALRVKYLGKKGALTAVLKQMGGLSAEERPIIGQLANEVREALTTALEQEQKRIEKAALDARLELEQVDVTIRGAGCHCPRQARDDGPPAPHVYRPGRDQGYLRGHGLPSAGRPRGGAGRI